MTALKTSQAVKSVSYREERRSRERLPPVPLFFLCHPEEWKGARGVQVGPDAGTRTLCSRGEGGGLGPRGLFPVACVGLGWKLGHTRGPLPGRHSRARGPGWPGGCALRSRVHLQQGGSCLLRYRRQNLQLFSGDTQKVNLFSGIMKYEKEVSSPSVAFSTCGSVSGNGAAGNRAPATSRRLQEAGQHALQARTE